MKKLRITLLLVLISSWAMGQTAPKKIPISVAYMGHFLYQPGLKIGTHFSLKDWEVEKDRKKGSFTQTKTLYLSPQIGLYTRPENHTSLLLNADLGIRKDREGRKSFTTFGVGLGYLSQATLLSFIVNLSDGSTQEKIRDRRGYFMPTVHYAYGKKISPSLEWYSKISVGGKLSANYAGAIVTFVELGFTFNLPKKK